MVIILSTLTLRNIKSEYCRESFGVIKVINDLFIHFLFFGGGKGGLSVSIGRLYTILRSVNQFPFLV